MAGKAKAPWTFPQHGGTCLRRQPSGRLALGTLGITDSGSKWFDSAGRRWSSPWFWVAVIGVAAALFILGRATQAEAAGVRAGARPPASQIGHPLRPGTGSPPVTKPNETPPAGKQPAPPVESTPSQLPKPAPPPPKARPGSISVPLARPATATPGGTASAPPPAPAPARVAYTRPDPMTSALPSQPQAAQGNGGRSAGPALALGHPRTETAALGVNAAPEFRSPVCCGQPLFGRVALPLGTGFADSSALADKGPAPSHPPLPGSPRWPSSVLDGHGMMASVARSGKSSVAWAALLVALVCLLQPTRRRFRPPGQMVRLAPASLIERPG
jgi:hypothetical protein